MFSNTIASNAVAMSKLSIVALFAVAKGVVAMDIIAVHADTTCVIELTCAVAAALTTFKLEIKALSL